MARSQTAGRGRRARAWESPLGNLYASLCLHPADPPARMALRSFAAALALRDALLQNGAQDVSLKWPNDVLLGGAKVAGILLESSPRGALPCLAIGFGVNLISHPPQGALKEGHAAPPTSLRAQTGQTIAPEAFLADLAAAYAAREAQFTAHGFAPLREAFLAHAARMGTEITARLANGTAHTGRYDSIDHDGNLILTTPTARHVIAAADVFF